MNRFYFSFDLASCLPPSSGDRRVPPSRVCSWKINCWESGLVVQLLVGPALWMALVKGSRGGADTRSSGPPRAGPFLLSGSAPGRRSGRQPAAPRGQDHRRCKEAACNHKNQKCHCEFTLQRHAVVHVAKRSKSTTGKSESELEVLDSEIASGLESLPQKRLPKRKVFIEEAAQQK